ncbi:MAG: hypothetical protein IPP13_03600 [Kouleothrix sp.]|jgi:hypothetical protein|nr:hypothetical protein [Kouleothrix sp.]
MLILNYGHPLTKEQLAQATALLGEQPTVRMISSQVDRSRPFAKVARDLADKANLDPHEWATISIVISPPNLGPVALALIAELHGRSGYFPAILNIRPVQGARPPRYEIAEIISLQALRDAARNRR